MKVAVLIMSTLKEPSTTNEKGMLETFIKYVQDNQDSLQHNYDFYFYYGDKSKFTGDYINDTSFVENVESHVSKIYCNVQESIYRTFEKTVIAFNTLKDYDWYVRINISNFINIKLLDNVLNKLDKNTIYCNAINAILSDEKYINEIYPRGDFYIISSLIKNSIMKEAVKLMFSDLTLDNAKRCNVIHVDDCLMGVVLLKTFGEKYIDMLQMIKYNFLPREEISSFNTFAISSRVKTIPPDIKYSGYSWEDNKYRREDYKKMKTLYNDYMLLQNYKNVSLKDIIVENNVGRTTLAAQYVSVTVPIIIKSLRQKKRG